ncbi:MAG: type II toxin-antitoxin system VapC family toxin [Armatimonadetes bacterium]|nr:type II toxin-antitoxin system VapC family toxin [Armatimonadota bacterium]
MLVDTSGWMCFLNQAEPVHAEAYRLLSEQRLRLTHSYVLAELVALAQTRRFRRDLVLGLSHDLLDNPRVEVVFVDESLHRRALDLLVQRPDKSYSLCDAVSFVLMRDRSVTDALTTDLHFEQEGFTRLLEA